MASIVDMYPALKKVGFIAARRDVPFVQQLEWTDCGAASLCMVMAYHGKEVKLAEVREAMGIGRDGVSAHVAVLVGHVRACKSEATGRRTPPAGRTRSRPPRRRGARSCPR